MQLLYLELRLHIDPIVVLRGLAIDVLLPVLAYHDEIREGASRHSVLCPEAVRATSCNETATGGWHTGAQHLEAVERGFCGDGGIIVQRVVGDGSVW